MRDERETPDRDFERRGEALKESLSRLDSMKRRHYAWEASRSIWDKMLNNEGLVPKEESVLDMVAGYGMEKAADMLAADADLLADLGYDPGRLQLYYDGSAPR